ncbi:MAG: methyl-accepting chemotaxis protein [Spirochaetaceae bacterium]|jgi:methyl-accepting chemotaxis protein|nr:methyl-accepting chemotaxis protein [Spirochaetaceae bacterium]
MKLQFKITLSAGSLVLAVAAAIGIAAVLFASTELESQMSKSLESQAVAGSQIMLTSFQADLNTLQEIANRARTRTMDWEIQQSTIAVDIDRIGFLDLAIVNLQGQAHYIKEGNVSDLHDRDYIIAALSGKTAVSDVIISRVVNAPVVMFAVPITDASGTKVLGALIGRRNATYLSTMNASINIDKDAQFFMCNGKGVLVAYPDTDLVMNQVNPITAAAEEPEYASMGAALSEAIKTDNGMVRYTFQGREIIAGFTKVESMNWYMFSSIPRDVFMSGIMHFARLILIGGLVALFIAIVLLSLIARSISKPIRAVSLMLRDISEGEGDLTGRLSVNSKDEIGELGNYFNLTMEKIQGLIRVIKGQTTELSNIGGSLSSNMNECAATTNNITATISKLKDKTLNQSASVEETSATMEQVTVSIEKLNEIVFKQTEQVSRSSAAIEQMIANIQSVANTLDKNMQSVKELSEAAGVGRSSLSEVTEDLREIAKESEGLLEINGVMENIASQTNLLSMNAAIEAAHAGEAGKGFAVVADEIRKLAENSSEQSKTISTVLKKITESIEKINSSSGNVEAKFDIIEGHVKTVAAQTDAIRTAMDEQTEGSQQVLESISNLNELTHDVKNGSDSMLTGSKQVLTESQNLANLTSEITGGMNEMVAGSDQMSSAITDVNQLTEKNKRSIDNVVTEVSRFKVE